MIELSDPTPDLHLEQMTLNLKGKDPSYSILIRRSELPQFLQGFNCPDFITASRTSSLTIYTPFSYSPNFALSFMYMARSSLYVSSRLRFSKPHLMKKQFHLVHDSSSISCSTVILACLRRHCTHLYLNGPISIQPSPIISHGMIFISLTFASKRATLASNSATS